MPAENVEVEVNPGRVLGRTRANGIAKLTVNSQEGSSTLEITVRPVPTALIYSQIYYWISEFGVYQDYWTKKKLLNQHNNYFWSYIVKSWSLSCVCHVFPPLVSLCGLFPVLV